VINLEIRVGRWHLRLSKDSGAVRSLQRDVEQLSRLNDELEEMCAGYAQTIEDMGRQLSNSLADAGGV
jgi:hypothetical protein